MNKCMLCDKQVVNELSFGEQIVCTHFIDPLEDKNQQFTHQLSVAQCSNCSLIQQTSFYPVKELIPPYPWLECTEPEEHLDQLVEELIPLLNLSEQSSIAGISWKDDTTLKRFEQKLSCKTWRLDAEEDLGIKELNSDIESVQDRLKVASLKKIAIQKGKSDFVFARHILEHAQDLKEFIFATLELAKEDGFIMFEIPDCKRALESLDYTTIWEEHTIYFTPESFQNIFRLLGLPICYFKCAEYTLENSLIVVIKNIKQEPEVLSIDTLEEEFSRYNRFSQDFHVTKKRLHNFLIHEIKDGRKVVVFGAAHMSIIFINLLDITKWIDFVVDDNKDKKRYLMPGSKLKILSSQELIDSNIDTCILSLSPTSEAVVIPKLSHFTNSGGKLYSIFPGNNKALPIYNKV